LQSFPLVSYGHPRIQYSNIAGEPTGIRRYTPQNLSCSPSLLNTTGVDSAKVSVTALAYASD